MATTAASAVLSRPLKSNLEQGLSQTMLLLPVIEISFPSIPYYTFLFTVMDIYGIFLPITLLLTIEQIYNACFSENHTSLI